MKSLPAPFAGTINEHFCALKHQILDKTIGKSVRRLLAIDYAAGYFIAGSQDLPRLLLAQNGHPRVMSQCDGIHDSEQIFGAAAVPQRSSGFADAW
jgi:hypothetical protein